MMVKKSLVVCCDFCITKMNEKQEMEEVMGWLERFSSDFDTESGTASKCDFGSNKQSRDGLFLYGP